MRLEAEKALSGKLKNLFSATEKQVLRKYLKIGNASDILSFQVQEILTPFFDLEPKYVKAVINADQKAFQNGRKSTVDLINMQIEHKVTLFDFDPKTYTRLYNQTYIASARTIERMKGNVMQSLAKSYQNGLGIKDAARNLKKEFRQLKGFEANRIARTEINSAQNAGAFQTYADYDINYHQWWSGQDARVRDSHRHLQGQITSVNTPFSNGLMYPGDRSGPIKEWINCRCTTVPYLMPLGYMAPVGMSTFYETEIIKIPNFEIPRITF